MQERKTIRRGTVLEPVVAARFEERLCVLLDDPNGSQVRVRVAQRDGDGGIRLTPQEFLLPPSALEALRPVEGLFVEV